MLNIRKIEVYNRRLRGVNSSTTYTFDNENSQNLQELVKLFKTSGVDEEEVKQSLKIYEGQQRKCARVIFYCVSSFVISWTPYAFTSIIWNIIFDYQLNPNFVLFTAIAAKMFVIWNPIIYGFMDRTFKPITKAIQIVTTSIAIAIGEYRPLFPKLIVVCYGPIQFLGDYGCGFSFCTLILFLYSEGFSLTCAFNGQYNIMCLKKGKYHITYGLGYSKGCLRYGTATFVGKKKSRLRLRKLTFGLATQVSKDTQGPFDGILGLYFRPLAVEHITLLSLLLFIGSF
uniref:G_PROTEIN_RECEP_F1_2 domain-containing protein n=1 Tax=Parastrongyloides trichosuri TaxID=131310 RepID=A0A0N4Z8I0_PARTI